VIYAGNGQLVNVHPVGNWPDSAVSDLEAACHVWDPLGANLRLDALNAPQTIPVHFEPIPSYIEGSGRASGVYVNQTGEIYIDPDFVADAIKQVAAHELGHAMGLPHLTESKPGLMQPVTDKYSVLSDNDRELFHKYWN